MNFLLLTIKTSKMKKQLIKFLIVLGILNSAFVIYSAAQIVNKDGNQLPEVTACNCTLPNYGCSAGNYACAMACGLTCRSCNILPSISAGDSLTFCAGDSVVLTANRVGTTTTYQWKKDSVNIAGATMKTFVAKASGVYQCSVKNNCNTKTSTGKIVVVELLPTVTLSASGPLSFCNGGSVTLTASTTAHQFQWTKGGVNI